MMKTARRPRGGERGQTLPVWTLAIVLSLTLTFAVFNYASTVRWQVRAQNAADSAAVALLAGDANAANNLTTLMYALSFQDYKLSTINNYLVNTVTSATAGGPVICMAQAQSACGQNLSALLSKYNSYATEFPAIVSQVSSVAQGLKNGSIYDQMGLAGNCAPGATCAYATNLLADLLTNSSTSTGAVCADVSTDCSFRYTVSLVAATPVVVDVVACRQVPNLAATFLHLPNATFEAVGRSTVYLAPLSSTLNTGTLLAGVNSPNVPTNIPISLLNASAGSIDMANLSLQTGYLVPTPKPPAGPATFSC